MCLLGPTVSISVQALLPRIPFQKTLLALDLVTPKIGNLNAWFNLYSGFNGCRISRFENRALIPFFFHASKLEVVAEVLFCKTSDFV